jgi:hypothetical protein
VRDLSSSKLDATLLMQPFLLMPETILGTGQPPNESTERSDSTGDEPRASLARVEANPLWEPSKQGCVIQDEFADLDV